MTRDVTERKRAQEAIQQREDIYRTIFESTGTAMIIIDEDTTISLANSEFVHLSGYPREEIENRQSWKMFVAAEDVERMARYHVLRRRPGHEAPRNYSFRFKDRYGIMKDMFVTATLLPGTSKSLISLLDITETKKAEEELRSRGSRSATSISTHRTCANRNGHASQGKYTTSSARSSPR